MRERADEDRELLRRMAGHDEQAMAVFYDRHAGRVYSLAFHICRQREAAEEVVQDAFLSVWREAAAYNPDRGSVTAWLFGIARNRSVDFIRKHSRTPVVLQEAPSGYPVNAEPGTGNETADKAENALLASQAVHMLMQMPAIYRQPLLLAYFQGLSQREIAEELGLPLGTVKTRLRTAVNRLRQVMI